VLCCSVGCSLAHWKDIRHWRTGFGPEENPSAEWFRRNSESSFYFCSTERNSGYFLFCRGFETEFREFLLFFSMERILSCFLFCGRVRNRIPRVFCSAKQPEFRTKYPFVPTILSSTELFFCRKFPTLVLNPPDILLESCGLFLEWLLILYPMKLSNSF
jgi:hypothetical protein